MVIETVEYRKISGFDLYRFGSDGTAWCCQKRGMGAGRIGPWRLLIPATAGKGYSLIKLRECGKKRDEYLHTLILEAFVGPRPPGMEACHSPDPDRKNCRIDNLRWDTPSANNLDKLKHGTMPRGETHYMALRRRAARLAG